jgi:Protein of unknown function (DUF3577)
MSQAQTQVPASAGTPADDKGFFDLHVNGVGYLNRIREVKPRKGQPFLACSVSALRGDASDLEYTKFDLRVTGAEARRIVAMLKPEVDGKKPVVIGFRIGDIYPELFTYERGEKAGQQGVAIKGRLLKIGFAKVDGEPMVLPTAETQPQAEPAAQ